MSGQRRRRPDPERTAPIRNASNLFRSDDSWDGPEPFEEEDYGRGEDWREVVDRSVAMGYEVVDDDMSYDDMDDDDMDYDEEIDRIGYGARAARDINDQGYGLGRMGDDFWEMSGRALRWYTDMWAFWSQLLTGGMMPGCRPPRTRWPEGGPPRPRPRPWRRASTLVDVEARRPVAVAVDLRIPPGVFVTPHVHGLHSQERDRMSRPPLTDIRFHPGSIPEAIHVHVRIPDDQPDGLYAGTVFDRRTERRLGTMSVRIERRFVPRPSSGSDVGMQSTEEEPPEPEPPLYDRD